MMPIPHYKSNSTGGLPGAGMIKKKAPAKKRASKKASLLNKVKTMIGKTGITTSDDIDKLMKQLFGDRYIGVYSWQTVRDVPKLKDGQIAVLNKDVHWTAVYKKKCKLYEVDSFNRDLLGPTIHR